MSTPLKNYKVELLQYHETIAGYAHNDGWVEYIIDKARSPNDALNKARKLKSDGSWEEGFRVEPVNTDE